MAHRAERWVLQLTENVQVAVHFRLIRENIGWTSVCDEFGQSASGHTKHVAICRLQAIIGTYILGLADEGMLNDVLQNSDAEVRYSDEPLVEPLRPTRESMKYTKVA